MATPLTVEEVQTLYGRDLTDSEQAMAEMYIDFAEGEVESFLHRPITITEFTEDAFPDANGTHYFRNSPVQSLTAITVNGESKELDGYTLTPFSIENLWDLTYPYVAMDVDHVYTDGIYGPKVVLTYTAGLDYPMVVKSLIAGAVIAKMRGEIAKNTIDAAGGTGVKSITVEDYSITYQTPGSNAQVSTTVIFGNPADFNSIKHLRRPGVT